MLITLVTYNRPRWARRIIAHLLTEAPKATIAVCNNGGLQFTEDDAAFGWVEVRGVPSVSCRDPLFVDQEQGPRVIIYQPGKNLGGGGGRNELLKLRRPGEPFVRIDDDWLPSELGWLNVAVARAKDARAGLVRVGPGHRMEQRRPPPLGGQWRTPDCCGPLWFVTGELADALGGFYLGFGKTLLDDLEYSRRAAEWQKRYTGKRRVFEFGWPVEELGNVGTPWLAPWDLFLARVKKIERLGSDLYCRLDQPAPGWEQREAGRSDQEHE